MDVSKLKKVSDYEWKIPKQNEMLVPAEGSLFFEFPTFALRLQTYLYMYLQ